MKLKKLVYSTFLISFSLLQVYSQKSDLAAADKKYANAAYVDAIATYERVANKGYKDEQMFQKLGNAYYFNAELPKAEKWYSELFAMNKEQEPEYYYRYAQCLKSIEKYAKANEMLDLFYKNSVTDRRAKLYANNKNYLEDIKANSGHFTVENAGINSENTDYGSALLGNKLIFSSARQIEGGSSKVFRQNNELFTDLYSSEIMSNGKLDSPKPFGGNEINSKLHESTPVFTKDGKTMYFTRNNYLDGKKGTDSGKITRLKLYKATLEGETWKNVEELAFNSDSYSVAHPALSPDNKTLYFASDMPGTLGQSDLFKVAIKTDGSFGTPVNLGNIVNTEGRESFPFVSEDNKIFFASDGQPGLGGFDIFVATIQNDATITDVRNVGMPINSSQDDFALIVDKDGKGYFSSNRASGSGSDDIYSFVAENCKQQLEGIVTDNHTKLVMPNVKLSLLDSQFVLQDVTQSDSNGHYSFEAICGKTYYVQAAKADYSTIERKVTMGKSNGKTLLNIVFDQWKDKIEVGDDLGIFFGIKFIYFDLNKAEITKEAAFDLEKILDIMNQYPTIKIDIRSYTDSRQTAEYNQILSDKRAKATIDWLVKNGISKERLSGKGYGESQLLNGCSDGVNCSEEEHQANRRSEFIVTTLK